jgi:hypothetical protein
MPSLRRAMARPTKDLRPGFLDAGNNPRGSSNSSTPAFPDPPLRPSHRSVEPWLDPRTTSRLDSSMLETTPVGRATARRPRPWIRYCAQAIAASSHGSTHEGPRDWIPRCWKQPPWVEQQLDACVPGFATALKPSQCRAMARPTNYLATGFLDTGNNPRGSSNSSTPASLDSPLRPGHRRVEPWLDPRRTSRPDSSALAAAFASATLRSSAGTRRA